MNPNRFPPPGGAPPIIRVDLSSRPPGVFNPALFSQMPPLPQHHAAMGSTMPIYLPIPVPVPSSSAMFSRPPPSCVLPQQHFIPPQQPSPLAVNAPYIARTFIPPPIATSAGNVAAMPRPKLHYSLSDERKSGDMTTTTATTSTTRQCERRRSRDSCDRDGSQRYGSTDQRSSVPCSSDDSSSPRKRKTGKLYKMSLKHSPPTDRHQSSSSKTQKRSAPPAVIPKREISDGQSPKQMRKHAAARSPRAQKHSPTKRSEGQQNNRKRPRDRNDAWERSRDRAPIPLRPKVEIVSESDTTIPAESSLDRTSQSDTGDLQMLTTDNEQTRSSENETTGTATRCISPSRLDELYTEPKQKKNADGSDRVTVKANDFDDVGGSEVSDTDEELFKGSQELKESLEWTQTIPSRLYYKKSGVNEIATMKLAEVEASFSHDVVTRIREIRLQQPKGRPPPTPLPAERCNCGNRHSDDEDESDVDKKKKKGKKKGLKENRDGKQKRRNKLPIVSSSEEETNSSEDEGLVTSSSSESEEESDRSQKMSDRFRMAQSELERKRDHPARLHPDIWFNEPNQMNDGPVCRCSWKSQQNGIRHQIFPGEEKVSTCEQNSSNTDKLYHYVLKITPMINVKTSLPTTITHDERDYNFDGFSFFTHKPIPEKLPICRINRWNIDYSIQLLKEDPPEGYCVQDMELFWEYFFDELLQLFDVTRRAAGVDDGCPIFHVMPRFSRRLEENGKELLSMAVVLNYLWRQHRPVVSDGLLEAIPGLIEHEWNDVVSGVKGQLVFNPNKKPSSIRLDALDLRTRFSVKKESSSEGDSVTRSYPTLLHFGVRPSVLTYSGNPQYQKAWKQYVKLRHLLMMKPKLSSEDRSKLLKQENLLAQLRSQSGVSRDCTVDVNSEGFYRTGIYPDMVQHALMLLVAFNHIRFHWALEVFERDRIKYSFKNRALLELAFTHPSYRANYGTNADHARNLLSNCGIRQPEYGSKRDQHVSARKRGINTLLEIMSRQGSKKEKVSPVTNNERLEYLGDAVIEFLTTTHLFLMFPDLEEGGLATYRSALVQNKHLAVLAKKIGLDEYMLYAHGPDLCHETDLKHAMANAFEAVIGAVFLDGGLEEADRLFAEALFVPTEEANLHHVWTHLPKHPLQEQEPDGDRHQIQGVEALQKLVVFESNTGVRFQHIRLLAKAFTRRNVGYNFLTLGHNQRLEFLGDTVLQLITSEYLYKHFPNHHEGHLSLLRSSLVNNRTQSVICDDVGMTGYLVQPPAFLHSSGSGNELRLKDKADLVEAFLGALYIDRGLQFCKAFCKVCFYPRLKYFIISQQWNDPKSQLQQCCLTLRNPQAGEPDIPIYRVIGVEGPTNTRIYRVAVYFRGRRMSEGTGHSVQEAEMRAAKSALDRSLDLFPHLSTRGGRGGGVRRGGRGGVSALRGRHRFAPTVHHLPQRTNLNTAGHILGKYVSLRQKPVSPRKMKLKTGGSPILNRKDTASIRSPMKKRSRLS